MPRGRELGRKRVDFIDKAGKHVCGTCLYWAYPEPGVDGEVAEGIFLRDGFPLPDAKIGQTIHVECTRKGRVVSIEAVPSKQINLNNAR